MRVRLVRVSAEGSSEGPRDVTLVQRPLPFTVGHDSQCDVILLRSTPTTTTEPVVAPSPPNLSTEPVNKPPLQSQAAFGGVAAHHCSLSVDRSGNVRVTFPPGRPHNALWIDKQRVTTSAVLSVGQSISFGDSPHQFLYRLLRCPTALGPSSQPLKEPVPTSAKSQPPLHRQVHVNVWVNADASLSTSDERIRSETDADDLFAMALQWSQAVPNMMHAAKAMLIDNASDHLEKLPAAAPPQSSRLTTATAASAESSPSCAPTKLSTLLDLEDETTVTATTAQEQQSSPTSGEASPNATDVSSRTPSEIGITTKTITTAAVKSSSVRIANSYLRMDVGHGQTICQLNGAGLGMTIAESNLRGDAAHPMVTQRGHRQLAKAARLVPSTGEADSTERFALRTIELLEASFVLADDTFHHAPPDADLLFLALSRLTESASSILKEEPSFLHLRSPIFCCGDLHGSFSDLLIIARNMVPFSHPKYMTTPVLLLGDFVDRGPCSVEVVVYLAAWKVLCPRGLFLLRGNHEDPDVNGDTAQYGTASYLSMCMTLFGRERGHEAWRMTNDCFQHLPLAAIIDQKIFACHGGIPRLRSMAVGTPTSSNTSSPNRQRGDEGEEQRSPTTRSIVSADHFAELIADTPDGSGIGCRKFRSLMPQLSDSTKERALRRLARELVWNDPASGSTCNNSPTATVVGGPQFDDCGFRCNTGRGDTDEVILEFSKAAVEHFLERFHFSLLIRAHQHKAYGIELSSGAKVITLFSSCNYAGENAAGACLVNNGGEVRLVAWRRDAIRNQHESIASEWSSGMLPTLDITELPELSNARQGRADATTQKSPPGSKARSALLENSTHTLPTADNIGAALVPPQVPRVEPTVLAHHPDSQLHISKPKRSLAPTAANGSPISPLTYLDAVDEDSDTPVDESAAICG